MNPLLQFILSIVNYFDPYANKVWLNELDVSVAEIFLSQEIYLSGIIIFLIIFSLIQEFRGVDKTLINDVVIMFCLIALSFSFMLFANIQECYVTIISQGHTVNQIFYCFDLFCYDPSIAFFKILITFSSIIMFIYIKKNPIAYDISILILISILSMLLLLSANDLFVVYLTLEAQSLIFCVLIAAKRYSNLAIEAAIKYFILAAVGSVFFLYGVSLLYSIFDTTNFILIKSQIIDTNLDYQLILAILLVLVAVLFKLAIFPFHYWIGDVYEGASIIITAFISIVPKICMLYLFYKIILFTFFVYAIEYEAFFIGLAVISMFYGTVMALYQTKLIRVMAYSSVSHMSHLLLALCIGTEEAVFSFLVYLIIYILLSLGVFSMLILFRNKELTNLSIINIVDLSYLSNAARWYSVIICLWLLSMSGLPPFAGFLGKGYLFLSLIWSSNFLIALVVLLISVLASVFYIRLIRFILFVDKNVNNVNSISKLPLEFIYVILFLIILNIFLLGLHVIFYPYLHYIAGILISIC